MPVAVLNSLIGLIDHGAWVPPPWLPTLRCNACSSTSHSVISTSCSVCQASQHQATKIHRRQSLPMHNVYPRHCYQPFLCLVSSAVFLSNQRKSLHLLTCLLQALPPSKACSCISTQGIYTSPSCLCLRSCSPCRHKEQGLILLQELDNAAEPHLQVQLVLGRHAIDRQDIRQLVAQPQQVLPAIDAGRRRAIG